MAFAVPYSPPSPPSLGEQRMLINGVTWQDHVVLRDVLPAAQCTFGSLESDRKISAGTSGEAAGGDGYR